MSSWRRTRTLWISSLYRTAVQRYSTTEPGSTPGMANDTAFSFTPAPLKTVRSMNAFFFTSITEPSGRIVRAEMSARCVPLEYGISSRLKESRPRVLKILMLRCWVSLDLMLSPLHSSETLISHSIASASAPASTRPCLSSRSSLWIVPQVPAKAAGAVPETHRKRSSSRAVVIEAR